MFSLILFLNCFLTSINLFLWAQFILVQKSITYRTGVSFFIVLIATYRVFCIDENNFLPNRQLETNFYSSMTSLMLCGFMIMDEQGFEKTI